MSGVDVHISLNNVPQLERYHSENNRNPLAHQNQNLDQTKSDYEQRMKKPIAAEQTDGKMIDPKNKKNGQKSKDKNKKKSKETKQNRKKSTPDDRYHIDIEA